MSEHGKDKLNADEALSLESILAEYKSTAAEELDEKVNQIIADTLATQTEKAETPPPLAKPVEPEPPVAARPTVASVEKRADLPPAQPPVQADTPPIKADEFIDVDEYADLEKIDHYAHISQTLADDTDEEVDENHDTANRRSFWRRAKAPDAVDFDVDDEPDEDEAEEEGVYDEADLEKDGITLHRAAGKYGRNMGGQQLRGMGSCLLALIMLLLTGLGDGGVSLPGFLNTVHGFVTTMIVLQLFAMMLTAEVVTTGLLDLLRFRMGVESLVTTAALATLADAIRVIMVGLGGTGLPYSAVAAFALGASLLGIKTTRNAMKTTLRTAATKKEPYVVMSHLGAMDEGFALYKSKMDTEGFVKKTEQMDLSEHVYSMAAPLLLVASAVFALLTALGGPGTLIDTVHHFAAMTLVSAGFTGLLAYGLPYSLLARKLVKVGAALAGWGAAAETKEAQGLIVTDTDVFPAGTLSLSGVKIMQQEQAQQVLSYTANLIVASGSGLSEVFLDILRKENLPVHGVEGLVSYEGGGIGATIGENEVIVGSASLMNLMGIRLPQNLNVKNAVFTAISGELAGVFAINYTPLNSVKEALVSLLNIKIRPLFAVRDFNITPMMLQNKFQIPAEKINFLTYAERYALSNIEPDTNARPFAIFTREGLDPLTDVVVGGKRLRSAVLRNTILSVASSVIGLLLLASIFWAGAPQTASAVNLFYYLAAWLIVVHVVSRAVTLD
ncbi:MAG: hypothetical protein FWE28_05305 [Oscillospiraceae bacterium]|nr:hypothetical protein [Oscillospiraceae bacterium]